VLGDLHALSGRTTAPILVVWSEDDDGRQIDALARGAAATVVKPASPRLVGARLKRLVEIARGLGPLDDDRPDARGAVVFGPLRLDASRAVATCAGRPIDFTTAEFAVVAMLAARNGGVVERETIVRTLVAEGVGGGRAVRRDSHRSADMHVCRIRRKLEGAGAAADGLRLATVHGRGYALRREPT
jgi:DNA-binding response OmpR family regulator